MNADKEVGGQLPESGNDKNLQLFKKRVAEFFDSQKGIETRHPGSILILINQCRMEGRPADVASILGGYGWRLTEENRLEQIPDPGTRPEVPIEAYRTPKIITVNRVPHASKFTTQRDGDGVPSRFEKHH
jgi:hypothetical protein